VCRPNGLALVHRVNQDDLISFMIVARNFIGDACVTLHPGVMVFYGSVATEDTISLCLILDLDLQCDVLHTCAH